MPASPFQLDDLSQVISQCFPELAGSRLTLLAAGWDSVAVDVDDRWIFKFPRHAEGEAGLRLEAGMLRLVADRVTMRVPRLELHEEPRLFSRHEKIAGEHLLAAQYGSLEVGAQDALAGKLGEFYAQLHEIALDEARAAGAGSIDSWPEAENILRLAWPVLPAGLRSAAQGIMAEWERLGPDPYGERYGFFDGHGWNMAFDHRRQHLNGVYDFGDSGIGPVHREFIYSSLVSPDLTERIMGVYERHTGQPIDRHRVAVLTGTHRLWEVAGEAHLPDHVPALVRSLADWVELRPQY